MSRTEYLPPCRPSITDEDVAAVAEVLRSGWLSGGPRVAEFEEAFARHVGAAGAVATSSGTAAMHLLLEALGVGPGDEVITPSLTWVSTANLVVLCGATPVFAEVDRETALVTPEAVEACLSPRTRLIVPVHYTGVPVDLDPLRALARRAGAFLAEDAAHAIGTEYHGVPIGARGTSLFSFHAIKNITTGDGGMICSDDAELLTRVRALRFHGLTADGHDRERAGRAPQAEVTRPGYKYNLTDIAAGLGLSQLRRIETLNARRSELARRYRAGLAGVAGVLPLADPPYPFRHAWHLFVVRVDSDRLGFDRSEFMARLARGNVGSGIHFRAIHRQPYYREHFALPDGALPHTVWNSERLCSLPLFPDMTLADVDDVVELVRSVAQAGG